MSEFETGESTPLVANFGEYVQAKTNQLARLTQLLGEALPVLEHYDEPGGTNVKLIDVERMDLVIAEPALMLPIERPEEVAKKCSNFSPKFYMPVGTRETDAVGPGDRPRQEAIPPTIDDVLALKGLPKINSYEEARELVKAGAYKAFNMMTHATKPAFIRMLNLWPDFTADLVVRMSAPEEKYHYDHFEAELFVAYQIMSRLVDTSDERVMDEGEADDWYLCR